MQEFLKEIENRKLDKYIIVMDNLSCHKTPRALKFYIDNKINIVFNVTYVSEFNNVELCFRYIKRILYLRLYKSIDETENDVKVLLNDPKISNILLKNFRSTLNRYISFSKNYKYKNLNLFNYNLNK